MFRSPVRYTKAGTPFLTRPGVGILAHTVLADNAALRSMLQGFDESLGFMDYMSDEPSPDVMAQVCKIAGQTCYASFGPERSMNSQIEKYLDNIKAQRHGSVLEHVSVTVLLWGIDRSVSHELVRHRAGMAYSQLSQRYVDGHVLRFVERPEWQDDNELHACFELRIDDARANYEEMANALLRKQQTGDALLSGEKVRDLRKKVNQAARACLPNETETIMVVTGNARAWRHFIEMRASEFADVQIRDVACKVLLLLKDLSPAIFGDYQLVSLSDGTHAADTRWRKV